MPSYADTVKGTKDFYEILLGFQPARPDPPRVSADLPDPTSYKVIRRPSQALMEIQPIVAKP